MMKKLFALLLSALLCLGMCATPVWAEDSDEVIDYWKWSLSEDKEILYQGEKPLYRVDTSSWKGIVLKPSYYQVCKNKVYIDGQEFTVYVGGDGLFWLEPSGIDEYDPLATEYVYVAHQERMEDISDYLSGYSYISHLTVAWGEKETTLSNRLVHYLYRYMSSSKAEKVLFDVDEMKELPRFDLEYRNQGLSYAQGGVYFYNGTYYYLDYQGLDESFYDEKGFVYFEDQTLNVSMIKLDEKFKEGVNECFLNAHRAHSPDWYYETDKSQIYPPEPKEPSGWGGVIFFGLLMPLPFLGLGIGMPRSKKAGNPKYWYILAVVSALWLLCGVILAIILGCNPVSVIVD